MKRLVIVSTVLLTLLMLSLSLSPATAHGAAASAFLSLPHGYGFAGYATTPVGSASTQSGPIAPEWVGCNANPITVTNTVANGSLASYVQTGNAETTITTTRPAESASVQTTAKVDSISILQGLITASEVRGVVTSTITTGGASSTEAGTAFVGLKVAGNSITSTPSPNTRLQLANLGYVVLNEAGFSNGPNATSGGINMIDLNITQTNSMGLTIGTRIIIAQANSSETRATVPVIGSAGAYSLSATGGAGSGSLTSGPWSATAIECAVSSTHQDGVQGNVNASPYGSIGVVNTTASGQFTSSQVTALGQTTIQNLSSLNGLLHFGSIVSKAQAMWSKSGSISASVSFTNGSVNGIPVGNNPSPNKRVTLLGLGYVVFNEQSGSVNALGAAQIVNALDIHVTQTNLFSIPVGADIIIGHAQASANPLN